MKRELRLPKKIDLFQELHRSSLYSLRMESSLTDNHLEVNLIWSLKSPLARLKLGVKLLSSDKHPSIILQIATLRLPGACLDELLASF